jgi:hypothetical protein
MAYIGLGGPDAGGGTSALTSIAAPSPNSMSGVIFSTIPSNISDDISFKN